MTAISSHAGLIRYVKQQGEGAPPSGGGRTKLWGLNFHSEYLLLSIIRRNLRTLKWKDFTTHTVKHRLFYAV